MNKVSMKPITMEVAGLHVAEDWVQNAPARVGRLLAGGPPKDMSPCILSQETYEQAAMADG